MQKYILQCNFERQTEKYKGLVWIETSNNDKNKVYHAFGFRRFRKIKVPSTRKKFF